MPHETTPTARRRPRSWPAVAAMLAVAPVLAGCVATPLDPDPAGTYRLPAPPPATAAVPDPTATVLPPLRPLPAPSAPYQVARRFLDLTNGERPLRTVVHFPTAGLVSGRWTVAPGSFPLVLFSHGLGVSPVDYDASLVALAAAGFVVAAPTYPHTSSGAQAYDPVDLVNQPGDASAVITALLELNQTPADALAGHLDPDRIAAIGHSAGGYTTMGLLSGARDERIRAAIVIAGASLGGAFSGPPASLLFVHGDADDVVPYGYGRAAYEQVPWPKAFLTILGGAHADYLAATSPAFVAVAVTILDFLRATLYGDAAALTRIPTGATVDDLTRFESSLVSTPIDDTPLPSPSPNPSPSVSPSPSPSPSPESSGP